MSKPWTDDDKRRHFQRVKSLSQEKFERYMNLVLSRAYTKCEQHYEEALFICLTPKQRTAVQEKVEQIRVDWDGITVLDLEESG